MRDTRILTERQAQIVQLREEGLSLSAIADRLGTGKGSISSSLRAAKAKAAATGAPKAFAQTCEVKKPEATARALDLATDPFTSIEAAAKQCGFPRTTLQQFMKRVRTRYAPLNDAIREVKDRELARLCEDRAHRCLTYMDDFSMAGASVKDLAISAGVMIDKSRLLKDQATHVIKIQDIRKLDEMAKVLHEEMERRGMLVDVTPEKEKVASESP